MLSRSSNTVGKIYTDAHIFVSVYIYIQTEIIKYSPEQ